MGFLTTSDVTAYTYDAKGQILTVADPMGGVVS